MRGVYGYHQRIFRRHAWRLSNLIKFPLSDIPKMSDKFLNKYRIPSARWRNWNYADEAAYFITICTKEKKHFFGKVVDGEMQLSTAGKIAKQEWIKSKSLRPDMNLDMEIFQIMPNHIHGIIVIGRNKYNTSRDTMRGVSTGAIIEHSDTMHAVTTKSIQMIENNPPANNFGPQSNNLASIIRGFKSAVTMAVRKYLPDFSWQTRYHDHVIRDDNEFSRIAYYIFENPKNWDFDRNNLINQIY